MRGNTMIATLQRLGIVPSFSRPHVCTDNPYSEALFRTLKHTPAYPRLPFASRDAARQWVARFVAWYNTEHRHSATRYVTPDQRHLGADVAILARRRVLYERARQRTPGRWSSKTRNWTLVAMVILNPEPSATRIRCGILMSAATTLTPTEAIHRSGNSCDLFEAAADALLRATQDWENVGGA